MGSIYAGSRRIPYLHIQIKCNLMFYRFDESGCARTDVDRCTPQDYQERRVDWFRDVVINIMTVAIQDARDQSYLAKARPESSPLPHLQ